MAKTAELSARVTPARKAQVAQVALEMHLDTGLEVTESDVVRLAVNDLLERYGYGGYDEPTDD